jgi:hypothetical protein
VIRKWCVHTAGLRRADAIRFLLACTTTVYFACFQTESIVQSSDGTHCSVDDSPPQELAPRPTVHVASGVTRWFVLREVHVTSEGKKDSADAWRHIGLDLDHRNTQGDDAATSTNTCRRAAGSATCVLVDGAGGIDNNFGAWLMATMKSFFCAEDADANANLAAGNENLLLRVANVVDGDEADAPGALYETGALAGTPRFDGSEAWPVVSTSLLDGVDLGRPVVTFPDGYIAGGTWVSGPASARFDVPFHWAAGFNDAWLGLNTCAHDSTVRFAAPVDAGVVTFRFADGVGTLAGAMDVTSALPALAELMEGHGVCPGEAYFDQMVRTMTQTVDLVLGAPDLQDTTRDCDAMSIGVAVTMAPAAPPTAVVPPPPPPPDPCSSPDAGADAGADAADAG